MMKRGRMCLSAAITVCIILFMVFSPPYILENVGRNPYREWRQPVDGEFSGIVYIWHIVDFKAYSGSVSLWLEKLAGDLESKYSDVYVEVSAMTVAEYAERIASGESADIYSFPMGLEYAEKFLPLDSFELEAVNIVSNNLLHTGIFEGSLYAIPFMYSGYALSINSQLAIELGIEVPETISGEWLNSIITTQTEISEKRQNRNIYGISGSKLIAAMLGVVSDVAEYDSFVQGESCLAISDFRSIGDLERKAAVGEGLLTEVIPAIDYTDLVQLIAINKNIDTEKLSYALEFAELLFSEPAQKELTALNAYSVNGAAVRSDYSAIAEKAFDIMGSPRIPNTFLYKRYKDAALDAAARALEGDEYAVHELAERLTEMGVR